MKTLPTSASISAAWLAIMHRPDSPISNLGLGAVKLHSSRGSEAPSSEANHRCQRPRLEAPALRQLGATKLVSFTKVLDITQAVKDLKTESVSRYATDCTGVPSVIDDMSGTSAN
ncbi:hypothetical protein DOTSEDRAFT_75427 [Dothistroma septosporum NZE10]|uniref:Uncharacterized protein n=1 Tax=Dothistroma septosporum (strain NZE10 / CBS 128990) TaxID=675120 RepID=M2XGQ3_DOTSN|nr:hypothetical protein DOTSEDRAFT_75427 [Dothistroma septosporum NZE10]